MRHADRASLLVSPSLPLFSSSVLVSHLQRHTISSQGAGLLARDLKQYQQVISSFHLAVVVDKWSELRQLIDLFFVGVEYLKAVITDSGKLSKLDPAYLYSWIEMRADWGTYNSDTKRKILASINVRPDASTQGHTQNDANDASAARRI